MVLEDDFGFGGLAGEVSTGRGEAKRLVEGDSCSRSENGNGGENSSSASHRLLQSALP